MSSFLHPLRSLRGYRALRILVIFIRAIRGLRELTRQTGFRPTLGIGLILLITLALATSIAESGSPGNIDNPGDAIWWAFATATTVGYGDAVPVTGIGRVLGVTTMLVGIVIVGALTAFVTTFLVRGPIKEEEDRFLSEINERLRKIEDHLDIRK